MAPLTQTTQSRSVPRRAFIPRLTIKRLHPDDPNVVLDEKEYVLRFLPRAEGFVLEYPGARYRLTFTPGGDLQCSCPDHARHPAAGCKHARALEALYDRLCAAFAGVAGVESGPPAKG
jgi:hypothetical protein